jgi:uncharacterized protein YecE (DUF72 family)
VRLGITSLEEYARHFNCVEGNTTLYALPKAEIVSRWYEQTHDDFRFCFKFPATISHQAAAQLRRLKPRVFHPPGAAVIAHRPVLAAAAGHVRPSGSPALWQFLDSLPREFSYGVEVRHPEFFAKGKRNSSSIAGCISETSTA